MSGTDPPPADGNRRAWPDVTSKLVIPIVVAVVAALAIAVVTPLGEWLRELAFPTKAHVSGVAEFAGGKPAAGAQMTLDPEGENKDVGFTSESGAISIDGVGKGSHTLRIQTTSPPADGEKEFYVGRGDSQVPLETPVTLGPHLRLGASAPATYKQGGVEYDITLWIIGDSQSLNGIESVTYRLPAPLSRSVTRTNRAKQFCFRTQIEFTDTFVIGDSPVSAEVHPVDGESFQVVPSESDQGAIRPECPVSKVGGGGGGGTGGGSSSGGNTGGGGTGGGGSGGGGSGGGGSGGGNTGGGGPVKPPTAVVPNVVGQSYESAFSVLDALGFVVHRVDVESEQAAGIVIAQAPAGGNRVTVGATVTLTVSKGASALVVPDVTAKTIAAATATLMASGFKAKIVLQDTDDPTLEGVVISQDPVSGTEAAPTTVVVLFVGRFTG
jgi:PASTA domain